MTTVFHAHVGAVVQRGPRRTLNAGRSHAPWAVDHGAAALALVGTGGQATSAGTQPAGRPALPPRRRAGHANNHELRDQPSIACQLRHLAARDRQRLGVVRPCSVPTVLGSPRSLLAPAFADRARHGTLSRQLAAVAVVAQRLRWAGTAGHMVRHSAAP